MADDLSHIFSKISLETLTIKAEPMETSMEKSTVNAPHLSDPRLAVRKLSIPLSISPTPKVIRPRIRPPSPFFNLRPNIKHHRSLAMEDLAQRKLNISLAMQVLAQRKLNMVKRLKKLKRMRKRMIKNKTKPARSV